MAKIDLRCATPECIDAIAKYGEHYHSVHSKDSAPQHVPDATAVCERCGGYHNGTEWKHVCKVCNKEVEPGQLRGLFVPHRCAECDAKVVAQQQTSGNVCRSCNTVRSYCCC
jgi:DNA-directed RNA polymerase subunit RPC12/RpoP